MDLDRSPGGPIVTGFSGGGFKVGDGAGGETVHAAVLLTPASADGWTPPPVEALTIADVAGLLGNTPEFLLIGTGATLVRPPVALVRAVEAMGIGVEAMDSRAAARAWGVLRSEGRSIVAALYPIA
ncbi:hypothetical protein ASE75_03435 [Sphingomonas sp. Leaf17]|uniref:Mth938-like domain-containing protein n=1 Tax=Sphingomonas sp. Leaf17 TaxID=1735683 RepID=UPI0006F9CDD8|nr:Mth938-like domain-containing protein [Sphingomonas sp. Leaf17]KQM67940.1 hypothetical protein ASE75_03435 [Sphingomonas sp. Leaf17]